MARCRSTTPALNSGWVRMNMSPRRTPARTRSPASSALMYGWVRWKAVASGPGVEYPEGPYPSGRLATDEAMFEWVGPGQ